MEMTTEVNESPSEEEVAKAFVTLGLPEKQAKIMAYTLKHAEGITQHELERKLDMRQPEVSASLGPLLENHWLKIVDRRVRTKDGRSRPVNIYAPAKKVIDIVDDLQIAYLQKCSIIEQSLAIIAKV